MSAATTGLVEQETVEPETVVRVVAVPRCEPPTDDEWSAAMGEAPSMTAPPLPLKLRPVRVEQRRGRSGPGTLAADLDDTVIRDATGPAAIVAVSCDGTDAALPSSPAGASPDVHAATPAEVRVATMRFISTFHEVVAGYRPAGQLRQQCRPDRFDRIHDHLRGRAGPRTSPTLRGAAALSGRVLIIGRTQPAAPPRVGRSAQRSPGDRLMLRRVQICQVTESVAEVVAVLSRRSASAAMAFRMEKVNDRWLCAHLEIV